MTDYTSILHMPMVAPNQNQKEATINTALAIVEAACNDTLVLTLSGNRALNAEEFTRYFFFKFTGNSVTRNVSVPNTPRFFTVSNAGTASINLDVIGGSDTPVVIEADKRVLVYSDGTQIVAVSSGVSALGNLSDVTGAGDASAGQVLSFDSGSGTWTPTDNIADREFFTNGKPTASQRVYAHTFARNCRLFSDFSGSQGRAGTAASANAVFNVYKGATLVGTMTVAAGSTVFTFSTDTGGGSTTVTFAPGDTLTIRAPSSQDANLADISVTLKGVYF
ncbi:hypothetical protein CcrColossus_gp124 [Caulobacter phage CcrColossus]|uniref:Tail fiber protein n=1 Tax=Caulobacter phage CcrColossus TaxID=1211640 RepID=K4JRP5_9CAUD|nr:hypothetical protein CcrColossus_gp124 [Caulobacter phage CcrColossus]AFU87994.1 hypothetical protein CcrColossus_gp124 [Caulobacter phage CcrColossus]